MLYSSFSEVSVDTLNYSVDNRQANISGDVEIVKRYVTNSQVPIKTNSETPYSNKFPDSKIFWHSDMKLNLNCVCSTDLRNSKAHKKHKHL